MSKRPKQCKGLYCKEVTPNLRDGLCDLCHEELQLVENYQPGCMGCEDCDGEHCDWGEEGVELEDCPRCGILGCDEDCEECWNCGELEDECICCPTCSEPDYDCWCDDEEEDWD
jgi:hypothetical protein